MMNLPGFIQSETSPDDEIVQGAGDERIQEKANDKTVYTKIGIPNKTVCGAKLTACLITCQLKDVYARGILFLLNITQIDRGPCWIEND